ncbi:MAG: VRR-NUC domain-containing protein [Bacteroidota bacterium]
MSESNYQAKLIKKLESYEYYVIKLIQTNKNGIADLLALKKGEDPWFIEVKGRKTKIDPLQFYRQKECSEKGFRANITREGDTFLEELDTIHLNKKCISSIDS